MWLVLLIYVLFFLVYAYWDLYRDYTVNGLFSIHRAPFQTEFGYVFDPQPHRTLREELARRLNCKTDKLPEDLWSGPIPSSTQTPEKSLFLASKDSPITIVQGGDENPILIIGKYRGEWITFRPRLGLLLETEDPRLRLSIPKIERSIVND